MDIPGLEKKWYSTHESKAQGEWRSRRIDDDKKFQKADTQFSVPQVHCLEEQSKAKEVENYQGISVPMEARLKLFLVQLLLLISSVFTEQSQIYVKNAKLAELEQGDLLWQDNLTHCLCKV